MPLFTHSACSEVQFLNLMESRIDEELPHLEPERYHHASLENIQYFTHILRRHAKQVRQCMQSLQLLSSGGWNGFQSYPRARYSHWSRNDSDDLSKARTQLGSNQRSSHDIDQDNDFANWQLAGNRNAATPATSLMEDYEYLLARCSELSMRCTSAMDITMNKALVLESQKAIEQSERLKKLSLLATFFIPLSFTSSLFGMNFRVFGQGDLSVWLYVAVAVPVTIVPFMFYICDVRRLGLGLLCWGKQRLHMASKSSDIVE
ncbi:MAG: hypothetical protein Q9166_008063 [cf. Caloplaca sp. 2 TL-2023]